MIPVYMQQEMDNGPCSFLKSPLEFSEKKVSFIKDILFLRSSNDIERKLFIFALGHEFSDPQKAILNRIFYNRLIIHFVVGGEGIFNNTKISKGDAFIAWPNSPHTIICSNKNPLEMFWIDIAGTELQKYIGELGLSRNKLIFQFDWEDKLRNIYNDALYSERSKMDIYEYYTGVMHIIMSYCKVAQPAGAISKICTLQQEYVDKAKLLLFKNQYQLSVEMLAQQIGLSRKYLTSIFLKCTGFTIQDYITLKKVELAKDMLLDGQYLVKDVADILGYYDYAAFSRAFKKNVGLSPSDFCDTEC